MDFGRELGGLLSSLCGGVRPPGGSTPSEDDLAEEAMREIEAEQDDVFDDVDPDVWGDETACSVLDAESEVFADFEEFDDDMQQALGWEDHGGIAVLLEDPMDEFDEPAGGVIDDYDV